MDICGYGFRLKAGTTASLFPDLNFQTADFRTPSVIAGLDPAIHLLFKNVLARWMDARVKPGHDDGIARISFQTHLRDLAARRASLADSLLPFQSRARATLNRGRGECRALDAPAASRAK
jgi:hypothetical protein